MTGLGTRVQFASCPPFKGPHVSHRNPENPDNPSLATPTRRIDQFLAHYGESHTHPANELIHYIAIPLIVFSLIGILHWIHPNLSLIVIGASIMYYARLSNAFMIAMTLSAAVMLYVAGLWVQHCFESASAFLSFHGFSSSSGTRLSAKSRRFWRTCNTC